MSTTSRGVFITFEGLDGTGKTTQMRRLAERLRAVGRDVFESAEPGGTPIGQQIRRILLDHRNHELCATAEMLLMFAARAQNVDQWILPALAAGKIVLSDRFTDSTLAYQGVARGLGADVVLDVDRIACRGLVPDLTVCLDIDPVAGLARAHSRNREQSGVETRLDEQDLEFYRRVREGYRQIASDEPGRVKLVDGSGTVEEIEGAVWECVRGAVGLE
ncbi:MAG: dTMP kinase [Acidobacteria bacterium]|nr:dTMP kinase [Acidobacteriota bacterium]